MILMALILGASHTKVPKKNNAMKIKRTLVTAAAERTQWMMLRCHDVRWKVVQANCCHQDGRKRIAHDLPRKCKMHVV